MKQIKNKTRNCTENGGRSACRRQDSESGRSMVEMLGTLAIMGVLAIGGVAGYRFAMDKYKANDILNEVRKRAVVASQQRLTGQNTISFSEYDGTVHGYTFSGSVDPDDENFFLIEVADVDKNVCDKVISEEMPLAVDMWVGNDAQECGDDATGNDIVFAFSNTLDPNADVTGGNQTPTDPACVGVTCPTGATCQEGTCLCDGTNEAPCGDTCCTTDQMCDNGTCVPRWGTCGENKFADMYGTCHACSYSSDVSFVDVTECHRCEGDQKRIMLDGDCYPCSYSYAIFDADPTECETACKGSGYERYMSELHCCPQKSLILTRINCSICGGIWDSATSKCLEV